MTTYTSEKVEDLLRIAAEVDDMLILLETGDARGQLHHEHLIQPTVNLLNSELRRLVKEARALDSDLVDKIAHHFFDLRCHKEE